MSQQYTESVTEANNTKYMFNAHLARCNGSSNRYRISSGWPATRSSTVELRYVPAFSVRGQISASYYAKVKRKDAS